MPKVIPAERYLHATPAATDAKQPLTQVQVAQWRQQGFALVSGLFEPELVAAVKEQALARYPAPNSHAARSINDFGSAGAMTFPTSKPAFNQLTLHPNLLHAIAQLLQTQTNDLRLTQSDLWPKYGAQADHADSSATATHSKNIQDNQDQRIHVDYPNHTLAHPSPWHQPEAVELIVYFDHHVDCGGSTAVVPRKGEQDPAYRWPIIDSPGIADLDYINDRSSAEVYFAAQRPALARWREQLYQRELYTAYKPGDVLLYRHDTWHRGTTLTPGQLRLAQNITYRQAHAEWYSTLHIGWSWSAYRNSKFLERLVAQCSLEQRAVLGFPQPGSRYWCAATLAAVGARYAPFGMDMAPYIDAFDKAHQRDTP